MPGFTDGWKLAKRLADDADRMDLKLPTYGLARAGDVGAQIPTIRRSRSAASMSPTTWCRRTRKRGRNATAWHW